jgi:UDP-N-acetyl-D-glucosamine dehydrogenase
MKISIIGQGYVGQTVSIGAALAGHEVTGLDINEELVLSLKNGDSYVPGIEKQLLIDLIKKGNFIPTTSSDLISDSELVVIAVPTPVDLERNPDLSALISASETINRYIRKSILIISESTSFPGTLRNIIKPIVEKGKKEQFLFAVAPERVDPGNKKWKLSNTTRVISGLDDLSTQKAIDFYSSFCDSIYRASSPEVAEAAKLLENTFRQVNIALVNEISEIVDKIGLSATEVIEAASTKPFGFMKFLPSIGVGGHCIPVDPEYLTYFASKVGASSTLINLANKINLNRSDQVLERILRIVGTVPKGLKIQIAGIAYKTGVSDLRESPAIELMAKLKKMGAIISWHDPVVGSFEGSNSTPLSRDIDLGLIVTPHDVIDFTTWKSSNFKVLDLSATDKDFGWPKFL